MRDEEKWSAFEINVDGSYYTRYYNAAAYTEAPARAGDEKKT